MISGASAHSRASGIFPASLKPSAFAKAWFRDRRSAADSFPDQALWALRSAADVLRMVLIQVGFRWVTISTFNVLIATSTRRPDHRPDPGRGQSEVSGCLSNLRSPLGSVIHGCALRVQKCTVGVARKYRPLCRPGLHGARRVLWRWGPGHCKSTTRTPGKPNGSRCARYLLCVG